MPREVLHIPQRHPGVEQFGDRRRPQRVRCQRRSLRHAGHLAQALDEPPRLFHWGMYAATSYGGGSLWLANQAGIVACIDPRTGKPSAIERLHQDQLILQLLAADAAHRRKYASDSRGLVAITPPANCWPASGQ